MGTPYPLTSGDGLARQGEPEERARTMTRYYGSFLLRHWHLGRGEQRFAVEHIQTGARTTATSLAEICSWIGEQANHATRPPPGEESDIAGSATKRDRREQTRGESERRG
jgi:hypothetical protein